MQGGTDTIAYVGKVNFEPGIHGDAAHQVARGYAFMNGRLDTSIWNETVALRMSEYRPAFVTTDGMRPIPPEVPFSDLAHAELARLWTTALPARPSHLGRDSILVQGADVDIYNILGINPTTVTQDQFNALIDAIEAGDFSEFTTLSDFDALNLDSFVLPSVLSAILVGGHLLRHKIKEGSLTTRRKVLSAILGVGLSTSLGIGLENTDRFASQAGSEGMKEFWNAVGSFRTSIFQTNNGLNGRTALLIQKHLDVANELVRVGKLDPKGVSAILYGYTHNERAELYLNDPKERLIAIVDLAKDLAVAVLEATRLLDVPAHRKMIYTKDCMERLVDRLSLTSVLRITDPGGGDFNISATRDPRQFISVEHTHSSLGIRDMLTKAILGR